MAEAHSYAPRETDALQIRDLAVMLHGGIRKQRAGFQQAAMVATKVHNMGGMRSEKFQPKGPKELYPDLWGEDSDSWEEEVEEKFSEYNPD